MRVAVRLFAFAREVAGNDSMNLELPSEASVGDVRRALVQALPDLAPLASLLMFAVDEQYADDATKVSEGADVACIPPVSGG